MTRREAWLTAALIFAAALVVRIMAASLIAFPKPEDTAYYVGVARNLVEGRGLVSDALWSYGTPPLQFPRPAFEVWLPLPSLLAAIPIALVGGRAPIPLETAMRAGQVVSVLLGSIVAVLAWRLAADVAAERGLPTARARTLAIGAGLGAAVYLPLVLHSTLPDSTMLFGALALGASLLMTRALRDPRGARPTDPRLLAIGLLLGAAALTRNEAAWLALVWAWLAFRLRGQTAGVRARLVGVVAAVSLLVFVPWAVRDWIVFGNPLPGQALSNALSVTGFDIFAWNDPPTLSRYLAVGAGTLVQMRVDGLVHNLVNVLLLLGVPVSLLGLLALPWQGRDRALRPVLLLSVVTFLVTSLLFPVATTWGTFLARGGAGPRAAADRLAGRARCPHRRGRTAPELDAPGGLARVRCWWCPRRPCSRSPCCRASDREPRTRSARTRSSSARWRRSALRWTGARRSSTTSRSGWRRRRACPRWRSRTRRRRTCLTWPRGSEPNG